MKLPRVLFVHNSYQHRGGEDSVVDNEMDLLKSKGHEVRFYSRTHDEIGEVGRIAAASQAMWSKQTVCDMNSILGEFRPDVVHVHNSFPLISPSLYWAVSRHGIPVVQTLHNFRLLCPQAMFLRDASVCEDCLGKVPWRGVVRACYRESKLQSLALASVLQVHRWMGSYQNKVARYIALNDFCRSKFIAGGFPADKIAVKPNFVADYLVDCKKDGYFLFVGRLSSEKGLDVLLRAFSRERHGRLLVIGDGPLKEQVCSYSFVEYLGHRSPHEVRQYLAGATALIMPSIWYETFGMVAVEAFAASTPVIGSNFGVLPNLIQHEKNGLLFDVGNSHDLSEKMAWANQNRAAMIEMGKCARMCYEDEYTAEKNYQQLIGIYEEAIQSCR